MKEDLDLLRKLLVDATARIAQEYFLLPVYGCLRDEPSLPASSPHASPRS
jgi:hypothetical protein